MSVMDKNILKALEIRGIWDTGILLNKISMLERKLSSPRLRALEDKHVLIAVPGIDKTGAPTIEENRSLFFSQWSAAHDFNIYLQVATRAIVWGVSKNVDDMRKYTYISGKGFSIDYLILLFKFIDSERRCLEDEVKKNHLGHVVNKDIQIVELY